MAIPLREVQIILQDQQEVVQTEAVQQEVVHLLEVHLRREVLHLQAEEEVTKTLFN
jgi:hypothetical protein